MSEWDDIKFNENGEVIGDEFPEEQEFAPVSGDFDFTVSEVKLYKADKPEAVTRAKTTLTLSNNRNVYLYLAMRGTDGGYFNTQNFWASIGGEGNVPNFGQVDAQDGESLPKLVGCTGKATVYTKTDSFGAKIEVKKFHQKVSV